MIRCCKVRCPMRIRADARAWAGRQTVVAQMPDLLAERTVNRSEALCQCVSVPTFDTTRSGDIACPNALPLRGLKGHHSSHSDKPQRGRGASGRLPDWRRSEAIAV